MSTAYRPEIDGLRAVAVIPVVLFHAGFGYLPGGFIGVDVFFAISGYLITGLIYPAIRRGDFSFAVFYKRRIRRLLPALYLMLLVTCLFGWFLLDPKDYLDSSINTISAVLFVANISLWLQTNYFSQAAELNPLLHTWSLSVEEQYYLVVPAFLLLMARFSSRAGLSALLVFSIGGLILSEWASVEKATANYYLFPTRAWEMALGSLTAIYAFENNKFVRSIRKVRLFPSVSLLSIVIAMIIYDDGIRFPGFAALLPVLATCLLLVSITNNGLVYRILSSPLFVGVGLVSYSLYLWHQPVLVFFRLQPWLDLDARWEMTISLACIAMFSYFSWRFIEKPFRNPGIVSDSVLLRSALFFSASILVLSSVIIGQDGFDERFKLKEPLTKQNFVLPQTSNGWCFYSVDTDKSLKVGDEGVSCVLGTRGASTKFMLFGDSYAGMYEPMWDLAAKKGNFSVSSVTTNWCHPSLTASFWWKGDTPAAAQCHFNRDYLSRNMGNYDAIVFSAVWSRVVSESLFHEVADLVLEVISTTDAKVVLMGQPPKFEPATVRRASYGLGEAVFSSDNEKVEFANELLKDVASRHDDVFFVEPSSIFGDGKNGGLVTGFSGVPYSWDGGHISVFGSFEGGKVFVKSRIFESIMKSVHNGN